MVGAVPGRDGDWAIVVTLSQTTLARAVLTSGHVDLGAALYNANRALDLAVTVKSCSPELRHKPWVVQQISPVYSPRRQPLRWPTMWDVREIVVLHYPGVRRHNWILLWEAAERRNIRLVTWEPHRLEIYCSDDGVNAYYDGERASPKIILHRTVSPFHGVVVPVLAWCAAHGTRIVNEPEAAYRSRDKLLTTLALCRAQIPVVPTLGFVEASEKSLRTVGGGRQLIVKPAHGLRGQGIRTFAAAAELLEKWDPGRSVAQWFTREHYLAQPLVNGGGRDVRAFVVDGTCVALMRRDARPGEVRANLAHGAIPTPLPVTHPAAATAVAAVQACQLDYGGVDLIEDDDGVIRVLEVDAWAGFAGITAATGRDVAGLILDLAARRLSESDSA